MLAGEDLPQLLQSLLVGVERAICRVPLDELTFPHCPLLSAESSAIDYSPPSSDNLSSNKRLECNLKRRDLITKNNCISNKYALKRALSSHSTNSISRLPHDIVAPRSIQEIPEKLLMAGIYLPGAYNKAGCPLIVIDSDKIQQAGINFYEIATVLLFYSTIPLSSATFAIHLIVNDDKNGATVLDKVDNSLQLLHGHIRINSVLITNKKTSQKTLNESKYNNEQLPISHIKLAYATSMQQLLEHICIENIPMECNGQWEHDQQQWKEFFQLIEPLQCQCLLAGRRLVAVLNDIRNIDVQGPPTRRQLHSQHRALSRALMDVDLQNLRRKGPDTIQQLQNCIKRIRKRSLTSPTTFTTINPQTKNNNRLYGVITVFNEVDRAAKRLEQLTEQRRERLRELTRQRALEEEINEVIEWIKNDGEKSLSKYAALSLECEVTIRDEEQDFEKYYFISMKHIAKGKDLIEAAMELESLQTSAKNLNAELKAYSNRLEVLRERIEGAARLHHLLALRLNEEDVQKEMQKLAEKIGLSSLIENFNNSLQLNASKKSGSSHKTTIITTTMIASSTPNKDTIKDCHCWPETEIKVPQISTPLPPLIEEVVEKSPEKITKACQEEDIDCDDDEETSKLADSGLGTCDNCYEGKLIRACSCHSVDDATMNVCDNDNSHNDTDLDDFDTSENITSLSTDEPSKSEKSHVSAPVPMMANAHLYCHTSNLQLDLEDSFIDQKTQKTLLLIIREMIGTERDYVRSLYYVIDNYMQELMREDIPQGMRGQRNVIFGNIERIHEFHQQHFLKELERYEHHPLKVGAAFLRHEQKFYLYALYNKNKPKSDSLMSEYGSIFFKPKQIELNDKMDLASYLLKPVQRMGKYALLLQQLMKACSNIDSTGNPELVEDLDELQRAEEMVRFQLRHGNDLLAMDSLRDCDVNVKEQGRLLRQSEFLVWEGRGGKKSLRQVFLFEELVLFSKARRFPDRKNLDIYIYKNSIKTSDIGLTAHIGDSPTKFEIWFRKRKPGDTWTLQCMSEDVKNVWADEVSRLLWSQAKRNREIRMAEMSSMGIGSKPCLDIRPSIDQINDRSISFSQLGKTPKFRNSFCSTLPDMKSSRRPNSIISLSSSSSSGGSSVSASSSASNKVIPIHNENDVSQKDQLENEKKHLKQQDKVLQCKNKHHRSTTIVSQCSMESGILADISSLSPEDCPENPLWPSSSATSLKKSNSTLTSVSASSGASLSTTSSTGSSFAFSNSGVKPKLILSPPPSGKRSSTPKSNSNSSISDAYLNEGSVTVHL
ncbi:unnamed protein product [Diamesa hyperborea]